MNYREATLEDVPLLARFNQHMIEDEGHRNPMTIPELQARMRDWITGQTYTVTLFSEEQTPVAYVAYRDDGEYLYLRHFFVSRDYRRQGFGQKAIALLLSEILPIDRMVRLDVLINNRQAHAFWKSVGFADYCITMELQRS